MTRITKKTGEKENSFMGTDKRKLLLLDLTLALIVIALFQLAPVAVNSRDANANLSQSGSGLGAIHDMGTFRIPLRHDLPLHHYVNVGD